jgi:hypothetical protein
MKPDGFVLNEKGKKLLEVTILKLLKQYVSPPNRSAGPHGIAEHEEMPAPEMYVALTPIGGIPALVQASSTPGEGDEPGVADCQIYKIVKGADDFLEEVANVTKPVYNLNGEEIAGETWVLVQRDKFGTWFAITGGSNASTGFVVELTSTFSPTTGYSWKRMELIDGGDYIDHPSEQTGQYAYTPDEDETLGLGTRGWLFEDPDNGGAVTTGTDEDTQYVFIPVYKTRVQCVDGELEQQYSVDGGVTWSTDYLIGVTCSEIVGTGTTTEGAGGGGGCDLAKLKTTDCLLAIGPYNSIVLEYSAGHWVSLPGTAEDAVLEYLPCRLSGAVDFWFEDGRPRLTVDGIELMHCGNGCFSGGPLTGHLCPGTDDTADCEGEIFTVCVTCQPCYKWYCVTTSGTCTGTGADDVIEVLELTAAEAEDLGELICDGPYDTMEEASQACMTIDCLSIPLILSYTVEPNCEPNPIPDDIPLQSFDDGETWVAAQTTTCGPIEEPGTQGWSLTLTCNNETGTLTYRIYDGNEYLGDVLILSTAPVHLRIVYTPTNGSCCDGIQQTIDITEP